MTEYLTNKMILFMIMILVRLHTLCALHPVLRDRGAARSNVWQMGHCSKSGSPSPLHDCEFADSTEDLDAAD